MSDILTRLEDWHHGKRGRYVTIGIDTTYGATCWDVVLGNVDIDLPAGWYSDGTDGTQPGQRKSAAVHAAEVSFFGIDYDVPPNLVFASEDDFVGLEKTIEVAIAKAEELGL